jgi:hypothetical protein
MDNLAIAIARRKYNPNGIHEDNPYFVMNKYLHPI